MAPANNKCGNIHLISHSLAWHTLRQPIIKFNDLDSISILLDPAPSFKLVKTVRETIIIRPKNVVVNLCILP